MELLILKENLKIGLGIIERIASKSLSLPILNNVLLSSDGNFLCLTATDLEIAVHYWALSKTEKEGKIVVPAKLLSGFIASIPEEKILLKTVDNILRAETNNFKTKINGFSPDEFPIIPKVRDEISIEVNSAPFCQGLSKVYKYATQNQARPEISGVYIVFWGNQARLTATDSFRLAEKKLSFDNEKAGGGLEEKSFIVPLKTINELVNVGADKKGKLKICLDVNQAMFEFKEEGSGRPQLQIISRLIEGEYPAYQDIIPKQYATQVVLDKDKFNSHLKTASLFSGRVNEVKIKVDPKKQEILISSQGAEHGENNSILEGKVQGEEMAASFNWRFLIDGLSNMQSSEVLFGLNGEDGAAVLQPVGDATYTYIVMPIKAS